jgi:hypothetical protein
MFPGFNALNCAHNDPKCQRKVLLTQQIPLAPQPYFRTESRQVRHCHYFASTLLVLPNEF